MCQHFMQLQDFFWVADFLAEKSDDKFKLLNASWKTLRGL